MGFEPTSEPPAAQAPPASNHNDTTTKSSYKRKHEPSRWYNEKGTGSSARTQEPEQSMDSEPIFKPSAEEAQYPPSNDNDGTKHEPSSPRKSKKFRFKSKSSKHEPHDDDEEPRHRKRYRPSRHKLKSRSNPPVDDPSAYDDTYSNPTFDFTSNTSKPNANNDFNPNPFDFTTDPESAFRESLFDAMADDEGAHYWQNVYGQPIHNYPRPELPNAKGELETMSDEEYAAYVRARMWEKSCEYITEERIKREKERLRSKEKKAMENEEWTRREKERLLKEKERRQRRERDKLKYRWEEYTKAWEKISSKSSSFASSGKLEIPWPTASGHLSDVDLDKVESFLKASPGMEYAEVLRAERVRWHPDKALQRWGRERVSEEGLKGVTAVFQIVDGLWKGVKD